MGTVALALMTQSDEDFDFVYAMKRDAFGPHILATWGWDEGLQRATLVERMKTTYFRILWDDVGTVAIDEEGDHGQLDEFYISPAWQNRDIGSRVIERVLESAVVKGLPVRAECLKWNPTLSFYRRHGFVVTSEGDTHLSLEHIAA